MEENKYNQGMKKASVYVRVSTEEQAKEGFSVDNQKRACEEHARNFGYQVLKVFIDDGKSGRTTERPAFQEMLKMAKEGGLDAVIIYKIDRFARNVSDFSRIRSELEKLGVKIISVNEGDLSENGGLIANILASVAQWESDVNGQRTRDALMQKFREGWQPTPPPIGYKSVGGDREKKYCEPDPYSAPIIKQLFELYSTGNYSIFQLQKWLSSQNILSRNGKPLGCSTIDNILLNPFYYGLIRWHGEEKIGNHLPIINVGLYNTCQYVLAKHRSFLTRKRKNQFLLRGFIYCSDCGQRYTAEWHIKESLKKRGGKIAYYHCQKLGRNKCPSPFVEKENLELKVENLIKNLEFSQEFIDLVVEKTKEKLNLSRTNNNSQRQALANSRQALITKRNKLEDALLDGVFERETYKRKHDEIKTQIENFDTKLQNIEEESNLDMDLIEEVLFFTRNIHQTYLDAPDFLKRYYLRFFYEKIFIKDKRIAKITYTPMFNELIQAKKVILKDVGLPR